MKTEFGIQTVRDRGNHKVVIVDTDKAHFKGIPFKALGAFGRKKFENLLVISTHRKTGPSKISYK